MLRRRRSISWRSLSACGLVPVLVRGLSALARALARRCGQHVASALRDRRDWRLLVPISTADDAGLDRVQHCPDSRALESIREPDIRDWRRGRGRHEMIANTTSPAGRMSQLRPALYGAFLTPLMLVGGLLVSTAVGTFVFAGLPAQLNEPLRIALAAIS